MNEKQAPSSLCSADEGDMMFERRMRLKSWWPMSVRMYSRIVDTKLTTLLSALARRSSKRELKPFRREYSSCWLLSITW